MSRWSSDRIKPQASSHCPGAGSSNAPSLGSAAADDWPRTGNASTTRRWPSCASPPSASCCENYAILHDVLGQTLRELSRLRPGFYAWCNLASQIGYVGETCLRWWEQWSSHRRGEALRE